MSGLYSHHVYVFSGAHSVNGSATVKRTLHTNVSRTHRFIFPNLSHIMKVPASSASPLINGLLIDNTELVEDAFDLRRHVGLQHSIQRICVSQVVLIICFMIVIAGYSVFVFRSCGSVCLLDSLGNMKQSLTWISAVSFLTNA